MNASPFVEAFQKLMDLLDNKPKLNAKIEREFPKAKDDAERVALVAPLLRMLDFSPISTTPEKSEIKSAEFRETGNNFYFKGNYSQALKSYNTSIALAPTDSNALSLAFANRSVTLKAAGQYKESIGDCQRALNLGYPEEMQYKIYSRLGQCYIILKQFEDATKNFEKAKDLLSKSAVAEPKMTQLGSQLDRDIAELEMTQGVASLNLGGVEDVKRDDVTVKSKPSKEMPAASECVHLVRNPRFGRHLTATTDINPGVYFVSIQDHIHLS